MYCFRAHSPARRAEKKTRKAPGMTEEGMKRGREPTASMGEDAGGNTVPKKPKKAAEVSSTIGVLVIGSAEGRAVVSELAATLVQDSSSSIYGELYRASIAESQILCLCAGDRFGPEHAIMSIMHLLKAAEEGIGLVLLLGGCGGLREMGLAIGDLLVAAPSVFYCERRIAAFGELSKRQGIGETATWPHSKHIAAKMKGAGLPTQLGKIGSGRSFDADPESVAWLQSNDGVGKDMESAAVVSTCARYNVPAAVLKIVSNNITGDVAGREHTRHMQDLSSELGKAAVEFLQQCSHEMCRGTRFRSHSSPRLVGVHIAMVEEAREIALALSLDERALPAFARFGIPTFIGRHRDATIVMIAHGMDASLACNRVGPEMATFAANIFFDQFPECELLINAGTAGAIGAQHAIADVVLASKVCFIDRRVQSLLQVGSSRNEALTEHSQIWTEVHSRVLPRLQAKGLGVADGVVGTGSSFDPSQADIAGLKSVAATVKEMEAAAVAFVAARHSCNFVCVKTITDIVGDETGSDDFQRNLRSSMEALGALMPALLEELLFPGPEDQPEPKPQLQL